MGCALRCEDCKGQEEARDETGGAGVFEADFRGTASGGRREGAEEILGVVVVGDQSADGRDVDEEEEGGAEGDELVDRGSGDAAEI